jgi:hypothetical protein
MDGSIKSPGVNRRWQESFRYRGSRQAAAVARLSTLGVAIESHSIITQ